MHERMHDLLNSYLDGELHGSDLLLLEAHLAGCDECRHELEALKSLSTLLHSAAPAQTKPVAQFLEGLQPALPPRAASERINFSLSSLGWLVPAGLLGGWFFMQTTLAISNLLNAASLSGLLGRVSVLLGGGGNASWFTVASLLAGGTTSLQSTLQVFNQANVLGSHLLEGFLWQALIVLLYWIWLGTWLARNRSRLFMQNGT
jgi:anti-sigma factor RsiW